MINALKIICIAAIVVIAGIVCLPLVAAGTLDPCTATARIAARNLPKNDLPEPWNIAVDELAVKIGAAYARSHGTLACYALIPKVSKAKLPSTNPSVVSADQSIDILRVR